MHFPGGWVILMELLSICEEATQGNQAPDLFVIASEFDRESLVDSTSALCKVPQLETDEDPPKMFLRMPSCPFWLSSPSCEWIIT
jgi:hypothetical protein